MLIWFLPVFLFFLIIGLPVFFGLLAAPGILLWMAGQEKDITLLYRNVYNGMDSFPLMAIPFFMLAGEMMNKGGITERLVEFSQALMGHLRGGLALRQPPDPPLGVPRGVPDRGLVAQAHREGRGAHAAVGIGHQRRDHAQPGGDLLRAIRLHDRLL